MSTETPQAKGPSPAQEQGSTTARIPLDRRILVAIDSSEPAEWAMRVAAQLAQELAAEMKLLHVVVPVRTMAGELDVAQEALDEQRRSDGEQLLRRALESVPSCVPCVRAIRNGAPPDEILREARVWEPDFIVMGTRGRGRFARLILGSTAEAVIRQAPCPVITVAQCAGRAGVPAGDDCGACGRGRRCINGRSLGQSV